MVEIGNGITTDGPISGAQASAPGQAPMLDENSLIPEAFIPKSASGGGGHWESLGTPSQAIGHYVEGDIYRIWSEWGCTLFQNNGQSYVNLGMVHRTNAGEYTIAFGIGSGSLYYRSVGSGGAWSTENSGTPSSSLDYIRIDHWVPDE